MKNNAVITSAIAAALFAAFALAEKAADNPAFSYAQYATVLKTHVDDDGMVDYKKMKEETDPLYGFFDELRNLDPDVYDEWSDNEKIAFWINAYNAFTLKAIVLHYPIKPSTPARWIYPKNSIRQIRGVWTILQHSTLGRSVSLNDVEHKILRKQFNEPRIHMALVCAAISCPPLRREPYIGDKLDGQLDDQSRALLSNTDKFKIDRDKNKLYL